MIKLILMMEDENGKREELSRVWGAPEWVAGRLGPILTAMAGKELAGKMATAVPNNKGIVRVTT